MAKQDIKEIIKEEYKKCALDPTHFIKKYCLIRHPQQGIIPFNLYEFQDKLLKQFIKDNRIIILKNRQMGISTLSAAYSLWYMIFHPYKFVYVVATKQDVAKNIIDKVRLMHYNLPSWLKLKCIEDNKLGQSYINGSKIITSTSTKDAGRSEAVSLLIVDECAHIFNFDDTWTALQPALSEGGDVIVLSTPNGFGNWFNKTYLAAEEGKNNFIPIRLHWTMHPHRDQAWRDQQDIELGPRRARQEHDGDFLASGDTIIDGDLLQWYTETYIKEPEEKTGFDKNIWIWEYPDYNKEYMLVADVARGDGKDYSTFHVIDIENLIQVAEYKGKIGTKDFGNLCVEYATKYNDAILIIENATIGWNVIQVAIDRNYKNLFYTDEKTRYVDPNKVKNKLNAINKKKVPGFTNSGNIRQLMISKMEQYFNEKTFIPRSKRLMDELFVFVWNGNKSEAAHGYNDDLVMALAIGLWVRDTTIRIQNRRNNLTKKALDLFKVDNELPIFNSNTNSNKNPYIISVGKEKDDISKWLL